MTNPKSQKQKKADLKVLYDARAAAHERNWLHGNKTAMETDTLGAGRQKDAKKK